MPVDRALFEDHLTRFHAPRWLCPRCGRGHFVLQAESVFFRPSAEAYARLEHDPEDRGNDLQLRFSATMQCDYRGCQETAAVAGVGEEKATNESGHRELYVELYPRFVSPSPRMFAIPKDTPSVISRLIESAFVLSWSDYESCLNRVRTCLEELMDTLRIPSYTIKAGQRKRLSLHNRIELAQKKLPSTKPFLMSAKHLGNAGSHQHGLTRSDAFDAFDLLEAVIVAVYGEQRKVSRLAGKIMRTQGPLKRRAG
jgi:hypothetical protein